VSQVYVNNTETPIEAVYQFPVDELAAVVGFIAQIDDKKIIAKCMGKEKASQVYVLYRADCIGASIDHKEPKGITNTNVTKVF
jgi:hypothetical protein